ncbi:MAG TPA: hypothetical protein VE326_14110 [Candidatus Binatia bacterium]|nr:hypothetical protein [Candidatus Binatia bacterium]
MRHPSVRGVGVRYLIAVLLPISGAVLVVYTAVQLAIAHVTHNVAPPRRIAESTLPADDLPAMNGGGSEPRPAHEPVSAPAPRTR